MIQPDANADDGGDGVPVHPLLPPDEPLSSLPTDDVGELIERLRAIRTEIHKCAANPPPEGKRARISRELLTATYHVSEQAASTLSRLRGERDEALGWRSDRQLALDNLLARALKAEDLNRKLAVSIGAMWDEYMKDECCDYVVINSLIERAHEDARSLLAPLKDRPGT